MEIFWKSDKHNVDFHKVMDKLDGEMRNLQYVSFAYLLSATGKTDNLLQFLSPASVSALEIKEAIRRYSKTERNMINFALQLFNSEMSDIIINDVFAGLDSYNYRCVMETIQLRFGQHIYQ